MELKAEDETGKVLFWSGYVPEDKLGRKGPVDPAAHFYRSLMLDEHGNPINTIYDYDNPPFYLAGELKDQLWGAMAVLEMVRME